MASGAVELEKGTPEPHGSPLRDDPKDEEEEAQVTPEDEGKRGTKRESPDKEEGEPEEEGSSKKRPSRERKTVERYSALSPRKQSASKALSIEQGSGTKLKDIPNVAFKLSKRKADENLQAFHAILFGRKSNVHFLKRNISQFSGYVWTTNQEKQKAKVKEKLDKYTKDKLIDFCDLLDIHFLKTATKKEEISAKLLEFLESPHATRDLLLADKEKKGKKRRSRTKGRQAAGGDASSDKETKKRKTHTETKVKEVQKEFSKVEVESEGEHLDGSDGSKDASSGEEGDNKLEESPHAEHKEKGNRVEEPQVSSKGSDDELAEDAAKPMVKEEATSTKKSASVRSDKSSSRRVSKKTAFEEDEQGATIDSKHSVTEKPTSKTLKAITKEVTPVKFEDIKKSSRKNVTLDASESGPSKRSYSKREDKMKGQSKENAELNAKKAKKKEDKPAAKVSTKKQGKGKKMAGPTTEELHSVVSNILKEVDFNTATLADILKKLASHFKMDLMDRKAEVKSIIEDVINNMTDDEDTDDDEDDSGDNHGGRQEG